MQVQVQCKVQQVQIARASETDASACDCARNSSVRGSRGSARNSLMLRPRQLVRSDTSMGGRHLVVADIGPCVVLSVLGSHVPRFVF